MLSADIEYKAHYEHAVNIVDGAAAVHIRNAEIKLGCAYDAEYIAAQGHGVGEIDNSVTVDIAEQTGFGLINGGRVVGNRCAAAAAG